MEPQRRCAHCKRLFVRNPRVKEQGYCKRKGCQRARKRLWQRRKMAEDPDYRTNQSSSEQQWHTEHPDYWRHYRKAHPEYCKQNRLEQRKRDAKRRERDLATMDALEANKRIKAGTYYLVPPGSNPLAKKDVFGQEVLIIPTGYARFTPILQKRT